MDQMRPREDLLKISKESSILVEFLNDFDDSGNHLLGIGFTNWLQQKDEEDVTLLNIKIDDGSEVLISWPENFEVLNFSKKTQQQLENCIFKTTSISILAFGTWDEMKAKQSNMLKFNQKNTPDKSSRHDHKRKEFGDDYLTTSDSTKNDVKKVKTIGNSNITKSRMENETELKKSIDAMVPDDSQNIYSSDESDEFEAMLEEKDEQIRKKEEKIDNLSQILKAKETEIEKLTAENNKLKRQITEVQNRVEKLRDETKVIQDSKNDFEKIKYIVEKRLNSYVNEANPLRDIANKLGDHTPEHVGPPVACCCIRLSDVPEMEYYAINNQGEICVKGTNVFSGYFKDPERTGEIIDEQGWHHTGDIGMWLSNGTLKIIDRKRHIFKLSQGEYIVPDKIENIYVQSQYVNQVFVYGESLKSCIVAIVIPDVDVVKCWAIERKIPGTLSVLCANMEIKKLILDDMLEKGKESGLKSFEQVKDIYLHPDPFSVQNGLLTPCLKLKRSQLKAYFKPQLEDLYQHLG